MNKISITNRGALEQNSGDQKGPKVTASKLGIAASPQLMLSSGTPGMKYVSFKDEKSNYFVLKRAKKEA